MRARVSISPNIAVVSNRLNHCACARDWVKISLAAFRVQDELGLCRVNDNFDSVTPSSMTQRDTGSAIGVLCVVIKDTCAEIQTMPV